MPLFMDYHKDLTVSVEEVIKAHIADEAVQSKYGVTYHQFWMNEQDGTVFCLMEGPDKESCAAVHREAHGDVACSIVEVSTGFYKLFMGDGHIIDRGVVKRSDGTPDRGLRNILVLRIRGGHLAGTSGDKADFAKELARSTVSRFGGREVTWLHDDSLVTVFDSSQQAVRCGLHLLDELSRRKATTTNGEWDMALSMGLTLGQPLTEEGDLFSDAITMARRLCNVANTDQLLISPAVLEFFNVNQSIGDQKHVRILSPREQEFITDLFGIAEQKLSDERFTVDSLSRNIGMSRPQLYRKMVSLTGKSPNDFIRDLRMEKALALIRKKAGNISEIALEVGYSNPSYFARCFQTRFGCTPSRAMA